MARKTLPFHLFTINYRTRQFDAVTGSDMVKERERSPLEILALTEVETEGGWKCLNERDAVNQHVLDPTHILVPKNVLTRLTQRVWDLNFGFLDTWRGVRIPSRFESGVESRESAYTNPLISALQQNGAASLRELEEYYSLEDAFAMYDVIVAKSVNAALANEAAAKEARANARR